VRYSLHPGAQQDLHDAATFYRERGGEPLPRLLFEEFERAVEVLMRNPDTGAPTFAQARKYIMKRFPFSVCYIVNEDELLIIAVTHHRRRPNFWKNRK
jgi:toxin ParE1/3/4